MDIKSSFLWRTQNNLQLHDHHFEISTRLIHNVLSHVNTPKIVEIYNLERCIGLRLGSRAAACGRFMPHYYLIDTPSNILLTGIKHWILPQKFPDIRILEDCPKWVFGTILKSKSKNLKILPIVGPLIK